eukprot:TRINITY_DN11525_c0_g1_i7.p1 TRINITY_DN11525_c0_g1~~TRINITY_DN11525_c0_g1_i7.p1  ORF type:complete len:386 (-),score=51.30 TRINITY_DN11525_c0_g1_i7:14-1171(-)
MIQQPSSWCAELCVSGTLTESQLVWEFVKEPLNSYKLYHNVIADHPFRLSTMQTLPIYFEITILALDKGAHCRVGVAQSTFQNASNLPGLLRNSYGYGSDGHSYCWWFDKGRGSSYASPFGVGDTIGCGICYDSYHQRKLFFTLNGKFKGFLYTIHSGMDPIAVVGVDGSATIRGNFGKTVYQWNVEEIYSFVRESGTYLLPHDVLDLMFNFIVQSPFQVLKQLALVSKSWNCVAQYNSLWKKLFYIKWPYQNPNIRFKSWRSQYKKRYLSMRAVEPALTHPIENCELEFECPILLEALEKISMDLYHCKKCGKNVKHVYDATQLHNNILIGNCVSFENHRRDLTVRNQVTGMVRGMVRDSGYYYIRQCELDENKQLLKNVIPPK